MFHRSIAQSGSAIRGQTADDATDGSRALAWPSSVSRRISSSASSRSIGVQIQTAFYGEPRIARLGNGPVIDGTIIPRHQWDPTAPSYSANVPFMMGSTENENGWVGPPPYELPDDEMLNLFTTRLAEQRRGRRPEAARALQAAPPRDAQPHVVADGRIRRHAALERAAAVPLEARAGHGAELSCISSTGSRRCTTTGWARITRSTSRSCSTTWTPVPR